MLFVVPLEELPTEGAAVLDAAEAIRELGALLQGSGLAFRVRVLAGDVRPAVGLGDARAGHQKGDWLTGHDPAAAGEDVELAGGNLMFGDGLLNEPLGQFRILLGRHHPAGDVTAE